MSRLLFNQQTDNQQQHLILLCRQRTNIIIITASYLDLVGVYSIMSPTRIFLVALLWCTLSTSGSNPIIGTLATFKKTQATAYQNSIKIPFINNAL